MPADAGEEPFRRDIRDELLEVENEKDSGGGLVLSFAVLIAWEEDTKRGARR